MDAETSFASVRQRINGTARRYTVDTFKAWRVAESGVSHPVDVSTATSLADAVDTVSPGCQHKQIFVILHDTDKGLVQHFYRIKQGKRIYRVNPETGVPGWVTPLRADHQASIAVTEFAPVEPWVCGRGADVVGHHNNVIEGQFS